MKNLFDFLKNIDENSNSLMAKLVFMIKDRSLYHFVDIEDFICSVPESLVLVSETKNFLKHIYRSSSAENIEGKKTITLPLKTRSKNTNFVFKIVCDEKEVYELSFETPSRTVVLNNSKKSALYEMRGKKNFCYGLYMYRGLVDEIDNVQKTKSEYYKLMTGEDREHLYNLCSAMYGEDLEREAQFCQINELI